MRVGRDRPDFLESFELVLKLLPVQLLNLSPVYLPGNLSPLLLGLGLDLDLPLLLHLQDFISIWDSSAWFDQSRFGLLDVLEDRDRSRVFDPVVSLLRVVSPALLIRSMSCDLSIEICAFLRLNEQVRSVVHLWQVEVFLHALTGLDATSEQVDSMSLRNPDLRR